MIVKEIFALCLLICMIIIAIFMLSSLRATISLAPRVPSRKKDLKDIADAIGLKP